MDAGIINRILDNLQKTAYSDQMDEIVRNLFNNILLAEYDEALSLIDSLLENLV